jgi:hypothetical protein
MKINLKNAVVLFHPNPSFEQLYFEAVANAIDAGANEIDINIKIKAFEEPRSLSVTIKDNGSGFVDRKFENFASLLEAENKDHKGLGRLIYLAYFDEIAVESFFEKTKKREFKFNSSFVGKSKISEFQAKSGTTLRFNGFSGTRINSYDYLKPQCIKESLLEHFFPVLFKKIHDKKPLEISIELETETPNRSYDFFSEKVKLTLDDVPPLNITSFKNRELDFFHNFDIFYSIENNRSKKKSLLTAICIDDRTIQYELTSLDSIPEGYQAMFLFNSDFFTGKINSSRQKLDLDDSISERTLKQILRKEIAQVINEKIPSIAESNNKLSEELGNQYPHLAGYFLADNVGLIVKNEAIENAQEAFFNEQKEILECTALDDEQYNKALEQSSRVLMEYILYRTKIIQKLKSMNPSHSETEIHNLIVPTKITLRKESFDKDIYTNNVWVLDDKYMTYTAILSDEAMSKVIHEISLDKVEDDKRPDITLVFSDKPEGNKKVDVVVVELKKHDIPLAKNEEVVSQLKQRARKLLKYYPNNIERIWFYGITDIDQEFRKSLKEEEFKELFSHGTMFYKQQKIIVEDETTPFFVDLYVLTYDTFINDAESRNSTFLRLLKNSIAQSIKNNSTESNAT